MTDAPALAITGATGAVGRLTAEELARGGTPVRLLAPSPERAPQLPRAVVVQSSIGDAAQSRAALDGAATLFLVPARDADGWLEQQLAFVDAAVEAGVEHIVATSFQIAAADAAFAYAREHFALEAAIRASGMAWTILRTSLSLDLLALLPDGDDVIHAPAGEGRVAAVANLDVARAATAVLREPGAHAGRTYELTGPEALSFAEIAETLSAATGRRICYLDDRVDQARRSRARLGVTDRQVEGWVGTYVAMAQGRFAHVSDDVERLAGRPPIGLRELVGR